MHKANTSSTPKTPTATAPPTIDRLIQLEQVMLRFRSIKRVIYIDTADGDIEQENDTEHSYDLTMSSWYLAQFFPELNIDKVIRMALVHDLVELHAGDTFTFGAQALLDSKQQRERAAYEQITRDWPDFGPMHDTIAEYEALATPEAAFVYAMDKLHADIVLYLNSGHTWKRHNISQEMLYANKQHKVARHRGVADYYEQLHALLTEHNERLFPQDQGG